MSKRIVVNLSDEEYEAIQKYAEENYIKSIASAGYMFIMKGLEVCSEHTQANTAPKLYNVGGYMVTRPFIHPNTDDPTAPNYEPRMDINSNLYDENYIPEVEHIDKYGVDAGLHESTEPKLPTYNEWISMNPDTDIIPMPGLHYEPYTKPEQSARTEPPSWTSTVHVLPQHLHRDGEDGDIRYIIWNEMSDDEHEYMHNLDADEQERYMLDRVREYSNQPSEIAGSASTKPSLPTDSSTGGNQPNLPTDNSTSNISGAECDAYYYENKKADIYNITEEEYDDVMSIYPEYKDVLLLKDENETIYVAVKDGENGKLHMLEEYKAILDAQAPEVKYESLTKSEYDIVRVVDDSLIKEILVKDDAGNVLKLNDNDEYELAVTVDVMEGSAPF